MHYTSIENIHKVIDPLFLDALKAELHDIRALKVEKTRQQKLRDFRKKLSTLVFLEIIMQSLIPGVGKIKKCALAV